MDTIQKTKACADCAHWNALEDSEGECRRHAPQNLVFEIEDDLHIESRFPNTSATDWCGDFSPKA